MPVDITFESMDDFLPDADRAQGRAAAQAARGAQAARQSADLHGRQGQGRGAGRAGCCRTRPCCRRWPRNPTPRARPKRRAPAEPRRESRAMADDRNRRGTGASRAPRPRPRAERLLSALLQGVRGPRTRRAEARIQDAVDTLAAAGAAVGEPGLERRRQDDPGDHRPARPEADRAGQPDPAPCRLPAAGGQLARPALPGQQHRNRRDAEDQGHEHLQERARPRPSRSSRAPPGTRARSSRRSTPRNTRCSVASRSAAWSATIISTTARATSACWRTWRRSRAAAHTPFIAGAGAVAVQHGELAGADEPA